MLPVHFHFLCPYTTKNSSLHITCHANFKGLSMFFKFLTALWWYIPCLVAIKTKCTTFHMHWYGLLTTPTSVVIFSNPRKTIYRIHISHIHVYQSLKCNSLNNCNSLNINFIISKCQALPVIIQQADNGYGHISTDS